MAIAMVVANCANGLKIPCLTFATVKEAEVYLTDIFGPPDYIGRRRAMSDCADKFFTSYYDGCGGVHSFTVAEVQHGQPFVAFDLD
jgi:hypothetical protein